MKILINIQIFILLIGALACFLAVNLNAAFAFLSGGALITLNVVFLAWVFKLIFSKKLIALSLIFIVFKYAILGFIIYYLILNVQINPLWFTVGLASFLISLILYVVDFVLRVETKI